MDPVAHYLRYDTPYEIVISILSHLPFRTLHILSTQSRSRYLHLLTSRLLWRSRTLATWDELANFIELVTINDKNTCPYETFVESLHVITSLAPDSRFDDKLRADLLETFLTISLKKLSFLRTLSLDFQSYLCTAADSLTLVPIATHLPLLNELHLRHFPREASSLLDAYVSSLCASTNRLHVLEVSGQMSSPQREFLSRMCSRSPRLQRLVWRPLRGFNGDRGDVDDETVGLISANCPRLREVIFCPTFQKLALSDASLLLLARGCPELEKVIVSSEAITIAGVEKALDEMPRLVVMYLNGQRLNSEEMKRCIGLGKKIKWSCVNGGCE